MKHIIITVARGFGSGGKEIASKVAKDLGIPCYENRIMTLAAQMSGLEEELFHDVNERIREKGGFAAFMKGLPRTRSYVAKGRFVSDDTLFDYQRQIIENLAETQSCVIVGKCADWILRGRDNVISLYIEAPRDFCLRRTMEHMQVSEAIAARNISRTDKYRADYYKYYTKGNYWTNPINYDMTLNSEKVGIEQCVQIIENYVKIKMQYLGIEQL